MVGILAYVNTFEAEFSFDDNFAMVYNRDVTDLSIPLKNLLQNDFWGSEIRREDSHKSFRRAAQPPHRNRDCDLLAQCDA